MGHLLETFQKLNVRTRKFVAYNDRHPQVGAMLSHRGVCPEV
jgi:hypothetical protein